MDKLFFYFLFFVLGVIVVAFISYLTGRMFGAGVGKSLLNLKHKKGEEPHETK